MVRIPIHALSTDDVVGFASAHEDLVTKDFLKAELASTKNDFVRWLLASQLVLVALLAALANFTKLFG